VGQAIGDVLPLAVGVALSPVPIIGVVLMLGTPRASANAPAFLLGWIIGLAIVGAVALLIAGGANASDDAAPSDWVSWLKLLLGALLIHFAFRQWRGRPRGDEHADLPKWMQAVDDFTPGRSVATGIGLSALNPKNLVLVLAAGAAIGQTGIDGADQVIAMAIFILVATLGPAIPVAIYFLMRDRSERILGSIEDWMAHNSAAIIAVICLLIAAKLIGDGISGLTA
jgi:threonine/homoserine/homoserine lactone efflux protein